MEKDKKDTPLEPTDENEPKVLDEDLVEEDQSAQMEGLTEIEDLEEIEEIEEKDTIDLMADLVRDNSIEVRLTNAEEFLEEPINLEAEEIIPSINELREREENEDICTIKGTKSIYLYSEEHISHNYANSLARVEEKDLLKLVAETVREESKLYPRPTPSRTFTLKPFNITKEELKEILSQLKTKEEYEDIKEVRASNGALYLYSERHMTKIYANSLAEWDEVERHENP